MTLSTTEMEQRLLALRRAFDESFAAPPRASEEQRKSLLVVRTGDGRFAVRLDDLAGIEQSPAIVPLPGGAPGLLGLVGIRGRLFAVYPLGDLVDRPAQRAPRWLLLTASEQGVAFAVDEIDAFVQALEGDVVPADGGGMGEHVREVLRDGAALRPVISVRSLLAAVEQRARAQGAQTSTTVNQER